jgi:hypothetical protein
MADTPFEVGAEEAFWAAYRVVPEPFSYGGASEIPATLDPLTRTTSVSPRGGRQVDLTGAMRMLVADWVTYGLKKGAVITFGNGWKARITEEPFIPSSGRGVVDCILSDQ